LNDRERFVATMHYQPVDRGIIQDFSYWDETVDVWRLYGLPQGVDRSNAEEFFGFDRLWDGISAAVMLCPRFEREVLNDDGQCVTYRENDGTIQRRFKYGATIPQHVAHTLTDRDSWERHYKWRLDPSNPDRLGGDLKQRLAEAADATRQYPLRTNAGSLFGQLRNWMGLEAVTYIQYDDPALFAEMIETIGDCIVGTLERLLALADEMGVTFDYASMWEDMSCAQGPLLSMTAFREHLLPQYRRISSLLRRHGCDLIMLDSDGDVRALLQGWLDAGVNVAFPLEVGTWKQDPVELRRRFGKDLRMAGGFDKHILASTSDQIAREIDRLAPLVEQGGFIPFCDHRVPPDVPLSNYMFYVDRAKRVWGKGLANLRPTGRLDENAPLFDQPYDFRAALERLGQQANRPGCP